MGMSSMLEFERKGDRRILRNTTFRTSRTFIGYATENREEYDQLISSNIHKHIVFTNRIDVPDMQPIKDTLKISQVESSKEASETNGWKFRSAFLPCSCPQCRTHCSSEFCLYQRERNIKEEVVRPNNNSNDDDYLGLRKLTKAALKNELRERFLPVGGKKDELVMRLQSAIEEEYAEYHDSHV